MNINIGEHKGKSVAEAILKHPDYVKWILGKNDAVGPLMTIRNEMIRLIGIFNSKPFTQKCKGYNCGKTATRCTAYKENYSELYWWCDNCDYYQYGAHAGTLSVVRSYQDVLNYVAMVCKNRKEDYEGFIKRLAQEKGLKKRVTKNDMEIFFLPEGIIPF